MKNSGLLVLLFLFASCTAVNITKRTDQFNNSTVYETSLTGLLDFSPARMSKHISQKDTAYYLSLTAHGLTLNIGEGGTTVLFTDGSRWESKNEVTPNSDYGSAGWRYSSFMKMTEEDLQIFSNKQISGFRLYIYERHLLKSEGKKFMNEVKALRTSW